MHNIEYQYFQLFNTPAGQEVLEDLKKFTNLNNVTGITDTNQLLYMEGQRDLVRRIVTILEKMEEE